MDGACGWGSAITLAQDMYSQMAPGCGPLEGVGTLVCDGLGTDPDAPLESMTLWACNVISCLQPTTPQIAALQATCAGGNALAMAIRCEALTALCVTEMQNAQPVCVEQDYPCPYHPSVGACGPAGSIRSDSDVTRDCARVVGTYGVSGPTNGQCMAECMRRTSDSRAYCPIPADAPACEVAHD